jgi:4-aminobutyrate aminotransferase-like enzyme
VFGGELELTKRFLHELFDDGVIAYYAGSHPTRVRFLPPLGAITDDDIDAVGDVVERALARLAPAGGP